MNIPDMIIAVRAYALAHYEEDGWDVVVEAWDDTEIEEEIHNCTSAEEAIEAMRIPVEAYESVRADIRATAF